VPPEPAAPDVASPKPDAGGPTTAVAPGPRQRLSLERISYGAATWDATLARYPDAEVYHSSAWLAYLWESKRAQPVVAEVRDGGRVVGHFVGAIVGRMGLRILGSPLRGWGTGYMGFLLDPGVDRRAAVDALPRFAFRNLGCIHLEIADRGLTAEAMQGSGFTVERGMTYVADLTGSTDAVLGRMRSTTRNYVRQGQRKGLTTEVATDEAFVPEFYEQLTEVFLRQGLAPTYGIERAERMVRHVAPSGQLLRLRVRAPDGRSLATGLFVGRGRIVVLWGAAFVRALGEYHPNELLHWEAMRYWQARGAQIYDMGGGGDYKAKYGGAPTPTAHFFRSRYGALKYARSLVRRLARTRQIVGAIRKGRGRPGSGPAAAVPSAESAALPDSGA
jgi:hypothetical protein